MTSLKSPIKKSCLRHMSPPLADRHRKPTNAVAKRLGRQMGAAHRKCTRVGPNCRDLAIGNWNVSPLTGKEQELVCEAQQYRLGIVGISSTKRCDSGTVELNGAWKIFYSSVGAAMSAQAGVGLLVSPNTVECVVDGVDRPTSLFSYCNYKHSKNFKKEKTVDLR